MPAPPFPVGRTTLVLIDHGRTETLPGGTRIPRHLRTLVFFPRVSGHLSFPLLVFGHGFAVTPLTYGALLQYWAAQGFVVAAPFFPLESRNAPGGPNESDLPNQPGDMSFLITRMLSISAHGSGPLSHLIDPHHVAVSGQSDGGDTALAVAYGATDRDRRVGAAVILSGAEIPGLTMSYFFPGEPPLLAVQGTADSINPPSLTAQFFTAARAPKYLLALPGARHLPPYQHGPDLGIVERVTVAFLRRYLEHDAQAGRQLPTLGNVAGRASLTAVR
jgi:fermentation-respiration switch protein FrsA (DUF1100 family)